MDPGRAAIREVIHNHAIRRLAGRLLNAPHQVTAVEIPWACGPLGGALRSSPYISRWPRDGLRS